MPREPIRNIGILAHIDAGKTTLTENLLHLTGAIRYPGAVEHGSTATDWLLQEQERGITIASAAITCRWRDVDITIVDTPGHVDFTMEVERSLRVLDGVVLVVSGPDGVQAQTETVWHQAYRRKIPAIALINKLDRPGFDDAAVLGELRERLGVEPVPIFVPIVDEEQVVLIDVLGGDAIVWPVAGLVRRQRARGERRALSDDWARRREAALERIVDAVASHDDAFAERVLAGQVLAREDYHRALRRAIGAQACLPVLYGVARFGVGVAEVADAIVDLLPTPSEVAPPMVYSVATGEQVAGAHALGEAAAAAFVFKTEQRARGERLVFVRIFAGRIAPGQALWRWPGGSPTRAGALVRVMGGDSEPVELLEAGMIGGLLWPVGSDSPLTGETLGGEALGVAFERIHAPQPVITISLEAPDLAGHERMQGWLRDACADDPSLVFGTDRASGQTTLAGMGELHLALAIERLTRETGLVFRTGQPTAAARRVVIGEGRGRADAGEEPGGRGRVSVEVVARPLAGGLGERLVIDGRRLKRADWRDALEAGLRGAVAGDGAAEAVVGVEIEVVALAITGPDPTPIAFHDAGLGAARGALEAAGLAPAEPWASLSVVVPDVAVGRLVGDLARRGARIEGSESRGSHQIVNARAPLSRLIGFATDLRSMTGGRGVFTLEPVGYEPVEG